MSTLIVPAFVAAPPAAATADDGSVARLVGRAARHHTKGRLQAAAEQYARADAAAGGRSLPAVAGLCRVALDRVRPDEAIRAARRWIDLAPTPDEAAAGHHCLGLALFQAATRESTPAAPDGPAVQAPEVMAEAADALREAADRSTGNRAPILLDLADVLVRLERWSEAAEVLNDYGRSGGGDPHAEDLRCWTEHELETASRAAVEAGLEPGQPGSGPSLPVRLHSPPPIYTAQARAAGVEGRMILRALLDR